jgi:arylsulfatase A-like enzyme
MRLFFRALRGAIEAGLAAGAVIGVARAANIAVAGRYLAHGLFRLLALEAGRAYLTGFAAAFGVVLWLGLVAAVVRGLTRSWPRAIAGLAGALGSYALSAWVALGQLKTEYGNFFPDAYQVIPIRFDTVLFRFIVPEGIEKLSRLATAVPALLTWLAWLAGGLAVGLAFQGIAGLPFRKRMDPTETPPRPCRARRLRIAVAALAIALLGVALAARGAAGRPARGAPTIVWISLDTLRADHVGCYGYRRPTTPTLDALAAESIVFDRAIAPSPWTLPTHLSLLTGLYPSAHGVVDMNAALSDAAMTVPEVLRDTGYRTAAVVSSYMLSPAYGYGQGFETFRFRPKARADGVTETAVELLDAVGDRPLFLFVHNFDIHYPWTPSAADLRPFATDAAIARYADRSWKHYHDFVADAMRMAPEEFAYWIDAYDASIRATDRAVGDLIAALKRSGRWDDTLLVVTSDHGEEWKDHGFLGHSITLFDEVVRVPLIIKPPANLRIGPRRVASVVSLLDVATTTVRAAGCARTLGVSRDLAPLLRGDASTWEDVAHSETALWGPPRRADVVGPFKRIDPFHYRFGSFQARWDAALYDVSRDPGERANLIGREPALGIAARLADADRAYREGVAATGDVRARPVEMDPATRERLRALGYVQ